MDSRRNENIRCRSADGYDHSMVSWVSISVSLDIILLLLGRFCIIVGQVAMNLMDEI